MPEEQPGLATRSLSKEQKMGFVFLLVFAVIGLILGVLQIRNTIFAPFALTGEIPASIKEGIVNDVNVLRLRDTDLDGLNDYEEIYEYGTSPYLFDSYSYGVSDKEVVEKGLARCANAGKNCTNESTSIASFVTSTSPEPQPTGITPEEFMAITSDPKQIRELLISNGMKKEMLDKVSDSELMTLVSQLLATSSTIKTSTN